MAILAIQTNNDTMIIVSNTELTQYQGMPLVALPSVMGMYAYNANMDSIESIMVDKALEKALNDALNAL